jgi:hypothetical protein
MGVVTSFEPGVVGFRILEYARYAVRLETREADGIKQTPKSMPTLELLPLNLPRYRAELLWRVGMPFSAVSAGSAGDSVVLRQSACGSFGQHAAGHSRLPDLQQSGDHQPGLGGKREGFVCRRRAGGASVHAVSPAADVLPPYCRRVIRPSGR